MINWLDDYIVVAYRRMYSDAKEYRENWTISVVHNSIVLRFVLACMI